MSTNNNNLNEMLLAITKSTVSTRHNIALLKSRVDILQARMNSLSPIVDEELKSEFDDLSELSTKQFNELDERTNALIDALEKYING